MADQESWETLGRMAEGQAGYVTTGQAEAAGVHRNSLRAQTHEGGRFERAARGLYRLRFYPRSPFEQVAGAWVQAGPELAVVSHESALELYGLADVVPNQVHLTLPRQYRHRRPHPGVRLHRPRTSLRDTEVRRMHGFRTTTPERTLLDVLEAGTQPEQVALGLHQALERGLTTPARIRRASEGRSKTTRRQLERLLTTQ